MTSVPEAANIENRAPTHPDSPRGDDSEKSKTETKTFQVKLDIEHAEVSDDPRLWSRSRKVSDITGYVEPVLSKNVRLTYLLAVCHRRHDFRSVDDRWFRRQHIQPYAFEKRCHGTNKL